jgi:glycosyltransferase involved in cell wall biosynthesis
MGDIVARAMKRALFSCDQVICLGDGFTRAMRAATGLDCVSVDNGTRPVLGGKKRALPAHGSPLELLFLGNFIRSKGLWAAAEATEILLHKGLTVRLKCAGSWRSQKERLEFEERFGDGMSRGAIQFLGKVEGRHKERALLEAHFLVLPTRYPHEGQPLVLIEAMSAGAVPVTTDQGGIPDLMSFGGSERLVSPSHETGPGIARTIEALVREPGEYEALSARCLERFRSHLTMDRCATEILAVVRGDADPGMEAWESKRAAV